MGGGGPASAAASAPPRAVPPPPVPDEAQEAEGGAGRVRDAVFERSIVDYLRAEGGEASSRNVGRTPTCNPTLQPPRCNPRLQLRAATQSCKPAPLTPPPPAPPPGGPPPRCQGAAAPAQGAVRGPLPLPAAAEPGDPRRPPAAPQRLVPLGPPPSSCPTRLTARLFRPHTAPGPLTAPSQMLTIPPTPRRCSASSCPPSAASSSTRSL